MVEEVVTKIYCQDGFKIFEVQVLCCDQAEYRVHYKEKEVGRFFSLEEAVGSLRDFWSKHNNDI